MTRIIIIIRIVRRRMVVLLTVRRMTMIITWCLFDFSGSGRLNSVYGAFIDPSRAARLFLLQDIGVLRML